QDTVHLGIREQGDVLYIDKIPGTRGLEMRSRVGHRMPLFSTGIGKALMLGATMAEWQHFYRLHNPGADAGSFIRSMHHYAERGYTLDLEENDANIGGADSSCRKSCCRRSFIINIALPDGRAEPAAS
ncbi:MAG: IclR family transcriptional regulator C-terminal domain-containing protein, partial [Escherichia sp.]